MSQPERYETTGLAHGQDGASQRCRRAQIDWRSCPDTNRLPSKNEIWSANVADLVHPADRFGLVRRSPAIDMKKVLARKRAMVAYDPSTRADE